MNEKISEKWLEQDNTLTREFEFESFKQMSDFTLKLFNLYEELNHHPDTLLYRYKFLRITTTTHDTGNTLTELDFKLAHRIDIEFEKFIVD